MKATRQENRINGSLEIPERRCEGITESFREISRTDSGTSRRDGAGHKNNDDEYTEEDRPFNPVRDVIRKTELLGWGVRPANHKRRKIPIEPDEETGNPEEE
jgi:hypothetical protein